MPAVCVYCLIRAVAAALSNFMFRDDLTRLNDQVRQFAREKFNYRMLAEKLRVECNKLGYDVKIAEDTTSRDIFKTILRR